MHAKPSGEGQYEHSSIISTVVHKLFKSPHVGRHPTFLTKRDEWAATFEWIFNTEPTPRTDCPATLPDVVWHDEEIPGSLPPQNGGGPISDLHKDLVVMMAGASKDVTLAGDFSVVDRWTEEQAAHYCEQRMQVFLADLHPEVLMEDLLATKA